MKKAKKIILMTIATTIILFTGVEAEEQTEGFHRLDEVVVTATKYKTSVKDISGSVTVITSEQLNDQNLPNGDIGDALRSVPGITLRRAYAPFPAYANMRGQTVESTVFLVNGIPTNWQISQTIPVELVERVEIIRGPASALYGANAGGGVINIILKKGGEEPKTSISAGGGSFGRFRSVAAADGQVDAFNYALAAYYENSDGANVVENNVNTSTHMIDECNYEKRGAGFNSGYRLSELTNVEFFYNFFKNRYTRGRPHVGGDWDYNLAGLVLDQKISRLLDMRLSAAYRLDDYLHLYDRNGTNYDPRQKRYMDYSELPLELQATAALGGGHKLTAGMFYNNQETDADFIDWLTEAKIQKNEYKVSTMAGYLQDVWKPIDPLVLTAGVRYDNWRNYDNYFSNFVNPKPEDRTDENISPKIGVRYNFAEGTSVWANYGMGFMPPTSEQLYDDRTSGGNRRQPNPDLKSEKIHSYEIGAEQWFGGLVRANLAGYYTYTDDKILTCFDAANVVINKNIGRSRSFGAELCLAWYPEDGWVVNADYTYNRSTIEENSTNRSLENNFLPFSPENKANLGLTYSRPDNFTVSAFGRYLSRQFTDDANTERNAAGEEVMMSESIVVDLKGTKHIPVSWGYLKKIDLSLSIDNLFNEKYRVYAMYEDPGTTYFAEVKLFF